MCKKVLGCFVVVCVLAMSSVQATVVFSDGFEAYTAGTVLPQSAIPPVGMQWYDQYSPSNDVIVTDIVKSGQQSLKMMRNGNGQSALIALGTNNTLGNALDVTISQDVYLPWWNSSVGGSCENYFGGVTKGGWFINGSAQIAVYQNGVPTSTGVGFERDKWSNYKMVFHLVNQGGAAFNGTWDFYVTKSDGTTSVSLTGLTLGTFNNGDLIPRLFIYASSVWSSNVAYYDNISMTVTPEPATLSIFGLGLFGLLRRRK